MTPIREPIVTFRQKRWFQRRVVELDADGIRVTIRSLGERAAFSVVYESVLREPIEFSDLRQRTPVFAGIAFAVGLLSFITALRTPDEGAAWVGTIVGAALVIGAVVDRLLQRFPRVQMLQLSEGNPALIVWLERPSRGEVDSFVAELSERTADYLRRTYGTAAPHDSKVGQLERLAKLREDGAISDEEFESLKLEIVGVTAPAGNHGNYL